MTQPVRPSDLLTSGASRSNGLARRRHVVRDRASRIQSAGYPRPRRPRTLAWGILLLAIMLLVVSYAGMYVALRASSELVLVDNFAFRAPEAAPDAWIVDYRCTGRRTWRTSVFAPCISVEEWWRNSE